jgi:hypothetical protein
MGAYADSDAHSSSFDWASLAALGKLIVDIGMLDFTAGDDENCELIIYDTDYPDGRVVDVLHLKIDPDTYADGSLAAPLTGAYGVISAAQIVDDLDYSGLTQTVTVGETVAVHDVVYLDPSDQSWKKAKADALATMPGAALTLSAADQNASCLVMTHGYVRDDSWAWITDGTKKILYVSGDSAGEISENPVSASGYLSQAIGSIYSATIIYFCPELALAEVA